MNAYLYMFIREDLPIPQQIIQTAHAVDELNKEYPHTTRNYMVLLSAKDEIDLFRISQELKEKEIFHHMFHETDINAYTAIATRPLIGDERSPMKKYKFKK